jgi:multicomponent Na+:H+ antiporter subunit B
MLFGIYSFLAAALFVTLDAVDVAFTEAAVGAGISTFLLLGTLALTGKREKIRAKRNFIPLLVVTAIGATLVYGTLDMPYFSDPSAPVHSHVARHYIEASANEVGVPNMVTAVLASYRGYDTLGEVTVIFTAGIGVLALLGYRKQRAGRS